jgi:hypothetical protein
LEIDDLDEAPRPFSPAERLKRPKYGGRKKGSKNRAPNGLQELARVYTAQALDCIFTIMQHGNNETARVAAAREILDRGYGKPKQTVDLTGDLTITTTHTLEVMRERARALRDEVPHPDAGYSVTIEQRDAA